MACEINNTKNFKKILAKKNVNYSHYNCFLLEHYSNLLFVKSCKVNGQMLLSVQHKTFRFLYTALILSNDKLGFKTKKNPCFLIVKAGAVKVVLQLCYRVGMLRVHSIIKL